MPRPSGSVITSAKLVVPAGTFVHANGGDTFSPTQFGFCLLAPAFFFASMPPSLKDEEVIVNTSAAWAVPTNSTMPAAAAIICRIRNITFLREFSDSLYHQQC